jgi:hypothetical protein
MKLLAYLCVMIFLLGCDSIDEVHPLDYVYPYAFSIRPEATQLAVDASTQPSRLSVLNYLSKLGLNLSRIACQQLVQISETEVEPLFDLEEIPKYDCYLDAAQVVGNQLVLTGLFGHMQQEALVLDESARVFNEPSLSSYDNPRAVACYLMTLDLSVPGKQNPRCILYSKYLNRTHLYRLQLQVDRDQSHLYILANAIKGEISKRHLLSAPTNDLISLKQDLERSSELWDTANITNLHLDGADHIAFAITHPEVISVAEAHLEFMAFNPNETTYYQPSHTFDLPTGSNFLPIMLQRKQRLMVASSDTEIYEVDLNQPSSFTAPSTLSITDPTIYQALLHPDRMHKHYTLYKKYLYQGLNSTYYLHRHISEPQSLGFNDVHGVPAVFRTMGYRLARFQDTGVAELMPLLPMQKDVKVTFQELTESQRQENELIHIDSTQLNQLNNWTKIQLAELKLDAGHFLMVHNHTVTFTASDTSIKHQLAQAHQIFILDLNNDIWLEDPNNSGTPLNLTDTQFFEDLACTLETQNSEESVLESLDNAPEHLTEPPINIRIDTDGIRIQCQQAGVEMPSEQSIQWNQDFMPTIQLESSETTMNLFGVIMLSKT